MRIEAGFAGQRMHVLPESAVALALSSPGTSHLTVTSSGFFPHANAHAVSRGEGANEAIIMVCVEGRGWCRTSGRRHPVHAGQVVVLPPRAPHAYGADRADPWTIWWLHARGHDLTDFLRESGLVADNPVHAVVEPFRIAKLMEEVTDRLEQDAVPTALLAASGAAWHVLATIASNLPSMTARSSVIEKAQDLIRSDLREHLSVAELAARSRLSTSHFASLFRRQVGTSVLKYQTQLRMAKARELLDITDWPVSRVAAEVGYPDQLYFSRQFSAIRGRSPVKYRALVKG